MRAYEFARAVKEIGEALSADIRRLQSNRKRKPKAARMNPRWRKYEA
jgi:hypothetical protein